MLADRLPGHVEPGAQLGQGLTVAAVQVVEETSPARVGQRPEHLVHARVELPSITSPASCRHAADWLPFTIGSCPAACQAETGTDGRWCRASAGGGVDRLAGAGGGLAHLAAGLAGERVAGAAPATARCAARAACFSASPPAPSTPSADAGEPREQEAVELLALAVAQLGRTRRHEVRGPEPGELDRAGLDALGFAVDGVGELGIGRRACRGRGARSATSAPPALERAGAREEVLAR